MVIKSQVLTGGRMKAGGVKFADTPDEAAEHAEAILELEIGGHMPRGVLVDPKAEVKQEYYAGVVWDGIRKQPVMLFSRHGRHRHRGGGREAPRPRRARPLLHPAPFGDFQAKEVVARPASPGASSTASRRSWPGWPGCSWSTT